jgi:1-acyl-sn-glycerol-3-phosphate acyltransferase
VANHISWLDIFAINAVRPAAFIAKAEIRQWPLIGWLAARNDTVFLRRGSHGHARIVNTSIDNRLNAGVDVALFPEGTTTDGTHLLGFHAALLQPAIETGRPILPLAISYLNADGSISLAPSFAGETSLMECVFAILASPPLTACLTSLPLIESTDKSRRELSQAAHAAIAETLSTRHGFRPANNPPEKSPDLPAG